MTKSRPARALRGATVVMTVVIAFRVPAIEQRFAAALLAAADPKITDAASRVPAPTADRRTAVEISGGDPLPAPGGRGIPAGARHIVQTIALRRTPVPRVPSRPLAPVTFTAVEPVTVTPGALQLTAFASPLDGSSLATAAYARLAAGDRRAAVRLFDAALTTDDPRAPAWRRQRDALTRRWSASVYSIVRGGGDPALAVTPVLGGGQSGATIAFTPDPLSPRPFAVTARGSIAHDDSGRSAFAAVGVLWHPLAGVTLAAERLIAVGPTAPNEWTVRLAAGTDRTFGRLRATAYGEGGLLGHATYAAAQGRAAAVFHLARVELDPGAGVWSSLQHDRGTLVDRVDVGPGVVARAGPFAAEVDYRFRVAGNAAPASGPVLTLSAAF